jgi:hypothetical protein
MAKERQRERWELLAEKLIGQVQVLIDDPRVERALTSKLG